MKRQKKGEYRSYIKTAQDYDCSKSAEPGTEWSATRITAGTMAEEIAKRIKAKKAEIECLEREADFLANEYLAELRKGLDRQPFEFCRKSMFNGLCDTFAKSRNGEKTNKLDFIRKTMCTNAFWSESFRNAHEVFLINCHHPVGATHFMLAWNVDGLFICTIHPEIEAKKFSSYKNFEECKYLAFVSNSVEGPGKVVTESYDMVCEGTYDYRHLFTQIEAFVERHAND